VQEKKQESPEKKVELDMEVFGYQLNIAPMSTTQSTQRLDNASQQAQQIN
jgi:hypothetical protein